MKLLARSWVWWPSINVDIENFVENCSPCAKVTFVQTDRCTYHPWPQPKYPFQRGHVDFFSFKSVTFFLFVDAYSKWFFVAPMFRTDSESVTSLLLQIFAFWDLPQKIVSNNGPPFNSNSYKQSCTFYDIALAYSPPCHPQSNSQA